MSYRVSVKFEKTEGQEPWMDAHDVLKVLDQEDLPESNFVYEHRKEAQALVSAKSSCGKCGAKSDLDAKHCKGCGEHLTPPNTSLRVDLKKNLFWSGNYANDSLEVVAPYVHGRLEAFFVGEDGEVFGGAILLDGTYTKCDVEMKLVPVSAKAAKSRS